MTCAQKLKRLWSPCHSKQEDTNLIEHQKNSHPTKLIGFVRAYIDQIEDLLLRGFTVEAVRELLETERGREINMRSFETCLYRIRKARKGTGKSKGNCIVQYNYSTPATPVTHEQKEPVVQPGDDDSPSDPVKPWKPEKKINPNLLALKERRRKKMGEES